MNNEEEKPPIWSVPRLFSFIKTAATVALDAFDRLPDTDIARRIEICANCEHSHTLGDNLYCKLCGCGLSLKALFKASQCPRNLWPGLDQGAGQMSDRPPASTDRPPP
jgi:hypothetical protein